jgi:hypothetical protein
MNPKCIAAVNAAAGKTLTDGQIKAIDDEMGAAMRRLARADPGRWQSLTADERLAEAGAAVVADIKARADRKLANAERQIVKQFQTSERIAQVQEAFHGSRTDALKRDLVLTDHQVTAERKFAFGSLVDLIETAGDKTGAGFGRKLLMAVFNTENPAMTRDIVREIFKNADGHTTNQAAKAAARAWLDTIEKLRTRFNAAGGDVGRLDYGYTPQPHDTASIRKAGADEWSRATLPLLDRSRYLLEDGSRMADDELLGLLRSVWDTLATEGLNKREPGAYAGTGARANRGSDSRQIHFADGDAWASYMAQFGRGSIYDAMMGHVSGMVRDIVLVERYGPDANGAARLQFDLALREAGDQDVGAFSISPQTYWDMLSGKTGAPVNETMARNFSTLRSLQVAAKLGAAVISSVTDLGTLAITTGYNRLPYWRMIQDIGSQASKDTREFMSTHGMVAESVADSLNRWSGDHLGSNWAGKLANGVLRLSLLNAWTDGLRQGFTLSMNAGLARMAKTEWAALSEFDRSRLTRAGIDAADWAALGKIQPLYFKGRELLTPQSIGDTTLAAKVFGFIHDEAEFAVVAPDMAARAVSTFGGKEAGTWAGEIARTSMQFKSFPISMMTRHWGRLLEGDHDATGAPLLANRTTYGMALLATLTGLGAVATQEKQILQGKDPIDMSKPRFWLKALTQGGGLSIAGDLFLVDPSSSPGDSMATLAKNLTGPLVGSAGELLSKVLVENVFQAAEGKVSHWEAEAFAWAKAQTPGANLWWLKPMVEHGFTNAINESLSPGYLARQQHRASKEWGNRWWWAPKDQIPQRAPDLSAAVQ